MAKLLKYLNLQTYLGIFYAVGSKHKFVNEPTKKPYKSQTH